MGPSSGAPPSWPTLLARHGGAGGPLQAAARTLLIRLAPRERITQYFGLFALTGKVTSFIGPLLIGPGGSGVVPAPPPGEALLLDDGSPLTDESGDPLLLD